MIRHLFWKGGWVALIFLAVAAGFGGFWFNERATARALEDRGVVTTATVDGMRTETRRVRRNNGTRTETDYLVTYAYETRSESGPVSQRVEHGVPSWLYEGLRNGQEVEIRYLPEDPTQADFFAGETQREARLLGWFALGFLLASAAFAALALRAARRARRLEVAGVLVQGIVEAVRQYKSNRTLSVRFTDGSGVERRAKTPAKSPPQAAATERGATVALRYDPADPSNVSLA